MLPATSFFIDVPSPFHAFFCYTVSSYIKKNIRLVMTIVIYYVAVGVDGNSIIIRVRFLVIECMKMYRQLWLFEIATLQIGVAGNIRQHPTSLCCRQHPTTLS